MVHIGFYQLGDASVNDAVLMLVRKTLGTGKKMLIFCPNPAAAAIDDALWSHDQNSWLPHGLDAAPGAELASVWVSSDMTSNPINADYLMLLFGSEPDSWAGFKRGFVVFDGKSDAQLQQARSQWQKWKLQSEAELAYFAQSASDGWEEKG